MKSETQLFCLFYSAVFTAFSVGIYLQSRVPELVNGLWAYAGFAIILIIAYALNYKNSMEIK